MLLSSPRQIGGRFVKGLGTSLFIERIVIAHVFSEQTTLLSDQSFVSICDNFLRGHLFLWSVHISHFFPLTNWLSEFQAVKRLWSVYIRLQLGTALDK